MADVGRWTHRLATDVQAVAHHFRLAASQRRVSRDGLETSCEAAHDALRAEARALSQLERMAERHYRRMRRAVCYSRYINALCAHLELATHGRIRSHQVPPHDAALLEALEQVGADTHLALRVVSAHKLCNTPLQRKYEQRMSGVPREERLSVALLLPAAAAEHVLVHGLSASTASELNQLIPGIPSEVACLDRKALLRIVASSRPPAPPLALCHGPRAWRQLRTQQAYADATVRADEESEQLEQEVQLPLESAREGTRPLNTTPEGSQAGDPPVDDLHDEGGDGRVDEAEALRSDGSRDDGVGVQLMLLCSVAKPADWDQSSVLLVDDPSCVQPLYLVQYHLVPQSKDKDKAPVLTPSPQARPAKSAHSPTTKATPQAEALGSHSLKMSRLLDLRGTKQYKTYSKARRSSHLALAAIDQLFAESVASIRAQLAPARAKCLAEEERRERELTRLLVEARDALARLKSTNRALVADLAGGSSRRSNSMHLRMTSLSTFD